MRFILTFLFLLVGLPVLGAEGEIIYQNCAGGDCSGAGSGTGYIRTVETSGCYSGSCLKLEGVWNSLQSAYGSGDIAISAGGISGKDEITIQYYIKYNDVARSISLLNCKSIRPYTGDSAHYFIATIATNMHEPLNDVYMSANYGTLLPSAIFTPTPPQWPNDTRFLVDNGDGTWSSNGTGKILGTFAVDGVTGLGTWWTKVTHWIKLPSTPTGTDGESKLWINNQLAFHFFNAHMSSGSTSTFSGLTFYPSSEADEGFTHWMDEMIVWEGYVPPTETTALGPSRSSSEPSITLPHGSTEATAQISTGVNATCKIGTIPNTTYASIANTMTGAGTTSHTYNITGLSDGDSQTYYIRCAKTSDGEENTSDYPIYVTVATDPINGACGSVSGGAYSSLTSTSPNLCLTGTVGNFAGTGPWTWGCEGVNGGASTAVDECYATYDAGTPPPVSTPWYNIGDKGMK